ncbi:Importin beta-like protein [Wickerhamomyces ciferrii]|uniref:Importin beta-like protein n=1 Tax=Wickerhamomyces ciferrii (strain ATCC 14091 / BCRC 22168 / CBS 111 / JCM 3599 / NBRC 0793 / NRRL Y-1031 F-60-10) TaxID=1206466 RepID=K0KNU3_WICCF|nr:Importin beta-like protein [Wickerhamomyces ciferrii]CCH43842.1 Importin beta-like protein [Wickerhamomyces ciferrii]
MGLKISIRSRLFELIDEPNNQLTIQNAQAISRICRFDFPIEWPTLIDEIEPMLQNSLQEDNRVKLRNILVILNQIIKNLAMAKIGKTRPALQSKIPIIIPLIVKIYIHFFNDFIQDYNLDTIEISYMALKNIRRIIVDVVEIPYHSNELKEFLGITVEHLKILNNFEVDADPIHKFMRCYIKIYHNLTKNNPTNLILFPSSKDILYTLLGYIYDKAEYLHNLEKEDDTEDVYEFIVIKSLLIFKQIINFLFKKGAVLTLKSKSNKQEIENAIQLLTTNFFTEDMIKKLTDVLINYYIKINIMEFKFAWNDDPEEWINEQLNENYEFNLRKCSENFFQDLINHFKDLLIPYVLNKVENEINSLDESSMDNILIKDSILTIFQLSSNSISDVVDINNLLTQIFFPEALKDDSKERNILKRRVGILINEWLGLGVINDENMIKTYEFLFKLLDPSTPNNDTVVKLTGIQVLKTILTDWDFKKELIKPYLQNFTNVLVSSVAQVEYTETKLFILDTISDLVYRTSSLISLEDLGQLLEIVPKFWDLSNDNNQIILKNSLLRILKNLIIALNTNSPKTWNIALPLIKVCCSPQSEFYTLLSEDGYELWLSILQHFPQDYQDSTNASLINELLELYPNALLNQTEILPLILEIFRSYTLLTPNLIIQDEIQPVIFQILEILGKYIPSMRDDSLDILISTLEIIILQSYNNPIFFEKLLNLLMTSGLLPNILSMILDDDQSPITVGKLLLIIARLSFLEPTSIIKIFEILFQNDFVKTKENLRKSNNIWYARMDNNIGNPRNRKIHILGLTSLLRTGREEFFNDFSTMISLWISSMEEINESKGDCEKYHSNYLYEFQYNDDLTIQENGEYQRFQNLLKLNDPVHNLILKDYLKDTMGLIKQAIGDDNFSALMGSLDKNLVENFEYFLYQINN